MGFPSITLSFYSIQSSLSSLLFIYLLSDLGLPSWCSAVYLQESLPKERDSTLAYLEKWYVSLLTFFYCHRLTDVPKLVTTLMTIEISIVPSTIQQTPQYNLQLQENQAQGEEQQEDQPQ